MKTAAVIAFPLLMGLAFALAAIRTFRATEEPADTDDVKPDLDARIDAALATETHDGRRMALRISRDHNLEGL